MSSRGSSSCTSGPMTTRRNSRATSALPSTGRQWHRTDLRRADMRAAIVGLTLWLATSPVAIAQGGGYPASPSHGVTGTAPDGTPKYGIEPGKQESEPPSTVGRGGDSKKQGQGGQASPPRASDGNAAKRDDFP